MTFKTSMNLGIITTIISIFSTISLYLYNKICTNKNLKYIVYTCSILILIGVLGLLMDINKITLIIYNFMYGISFVIFDVTYNARKAELVNEAGIENYKEEYIGYVAVTISIGRVLGYLFMLIASFFNSIIIFKVLLLVVSLFAPVYAYLLSKTENKM